MNTGLSTNKKKSDIIYNRLRAYIDENKFSANLRLPSENALCRHFQVSRDTVRPVSYTHLDVYKRQDFIPVELARLFYSRIKPKVSVELLG